MMARIAINLNDNFSSVLVGSRSSSGEGDDFMLAFTAVGRIADFDIFAGSSFRSGSSFPVRSSFRSGSSFSVRSGDRSGTG